MELMQVLQAPVVTEKSAGAQLQRKYTFFVHLKANKVEVAKAVEAAYGVKVKKVNLHLRILIFQKRRYCDEISN